MEPKDLTYDNLSEASHDAVHAARDAAQTIELARQLQSDRSAEAAVNKVTQNIGDIMQDRIEHVLARGTEQDKSIILARVPYICQDIKGIDKKLENIVVMMEQVKKDLDTKDAKNKEENDKKYVNQDQFWPIRALAYGGAAIMLTAVVGALVALVITK